MVRKQARRRKQKRTASIRLPRIPLPRVLGTVAAIGIVYMTYHFSAILFDRPISALTVDGPFQRVSALQIEEAISPMLTSGFLSADLDAIQARIIALPWIDRASVVRQWPSQIHITVTEQVPAAVWGDRGLLNTRGELFVSDARHVPAELPRLSGPESRAAEVAKRYLYLREHLIPLGLDVRALHVDPRGSWDLTLQNGIDVRLGRKDVAERTDLFFDVVANLVMSRAAEIEYVDMRYSNGFSIGWKAGKSAPTKGSDMEKEKLLAAREIN
jgi:cell division protein FtsQ